MFVLKSPHFINPIALKIQGASYHEDTRVLMQSKRVKCDYTNTIQIDLEMPHVAPFK